MTEQDLLALRGEFPALAQSVYMISHSLGAMPQATTAALQEFASLWVNKSIVAWEDWLRESQLAASRIERVLHAAPQRWSDLRPRGGARPRHRDDRQRRPRVDDPGGSRNAALLTEDAAGQALRLVAGGRPRLFAWPPRAWASHRGLGCADAVHGQLRHGGHRGRRLDHMWASPDVAAAATAHRRTPAIPSH